MENKISRLFDYQKFEGNAELQQVIDGAHERCRARALSLDEMEWVNAAGAPQPPIKPEDKDR